MAVEASFQVVSGDAAARAALPRFKVQEFGNPESVAAWLNQVSSDHYHLVSITPIMQTNHFNKEVGSVVWVVVERDADSPSVH